MNGARRVTGAYYVVQVREGGEWVDAYQYNEAVDAFDKADELMADGHDVKVDRRWLL
jgi:hypothetical protein